MFEIKNFSVWVEGKQVICDLHNTFNSGTTTVLLGHNGSGKTSLVLALMGHPRYTHQGDMILDGEDISSLSPDMRAARGIFLSFQNIPEIPGIRLIDYLRTIYSAHFRLLHPEAKVPSYFVFRRMIEKMLPEFHLSKDFLDRDLYVGFSGGEKRRIELLQADILDPKVILLDEADSGLDIDALSILRHKIDMWRSKGKSLIIISHNMNLL